jgi:tRNA (adenine57-N1/adenine58-N1)-methyltransferase catalytic subunit
MTDQLDPDLTADLDPTLGSPTADLDPTLGPDPTEAAGPPDRLMRWGELALLIDNKKRRYLITLTEGAEFQSHTGVVRHDAIAGQPEGTEVATSRGQRFRTFRPTLSDYVLSMPRGAQVIYPKDLGPILFLADIGPGMRVLESGVGSGALSMAMLRSGAEITGYEIRADFAARAIKNDRYQVELRDCYEGIDARHLDRVVLDLPEPWRVVPHARTALRSGGILVSYSPSIIQVVQTVEALNDAGFAEVSTTEVLNRTWHIDGAAVRPDHRMVAHTGFLTRARLLA